MNPSLALFSYPNTLAKFPKLNSWTFDHNYLSSNLERVNWAFVHTKASANICFSSRRK